MGVSKRDVAIPEIDMQRCTLCGDCVSSCPEGAVSLIAHRIVVDAKLCRYCGDCEDVCPHDAIRLPYEISLEPEQHFCSRDHRQEGPV